MLKKRIENESKRAHWSFNLALKNLAIVAANMVMVDQVKTDLKCLDEYDSLLSRCMHKFMLSATYPNCEGAYLYYDTNLGEFIRSGKVSGRGFEKRHDEHKAKSNMANASSNFYFVYQSQCLILTKQDKEKEHLKVLKCILQQDSIQNRLFIPRLKNIPECLLQNL